MFKIWIFSTCNMFGEAALLFPWGERTLMITLHSSSMGVSMHLSDIERWKDSNIFEWCSFIRWNEVKPLNICPHLFYFHSQISKNIKATNGYSRSSKKNYETSLWFNYGCQIYQSLSPYFYPFPVSVCSKLWETRVNYPKTETLTAGNMLSFTCVIQF